MSENTKACDFFFHETQGTEKREKRGSKHPRRHGPWREQVKGSRLEAKLDQPDMATAYIDD